MSSSRPFRRERCRWLPAAVVWIATLVGAPPLAGQSLNVLLTNDDGVEAPGIVALRRELLDAGHRVTVVAPLENQSGVGSAVTTSGTIDYESRGDGIWMVDGTPSDAVALALVHIMRSDPPDLVISGANFGQNVGASVMSSGTVGAALAAARAGVPAIALSVAIDPRQAESPTPYAGTRDALVPASEFVVEVVRQLAETGGEGLLPPRVILNVNYPAVGSDAPDGVRFASVSSLRGFRQVFSVSGQGGPARVEMALANADQAEAGSDLALLGAGFVTISVLDGDLDAGKASWEPLLERLIIER
ncbi:MAG: 5'/3'-nucleotidase SurE [Longimicrobiales bacterium]